MPSFSPCFPLLVPLGVRLVSSSPAPPLSPLPLACFPGFPIVMALSYRLPPRFPLSPPIAPPIVSNKRGDIALLVCCCHVRRKRAASLPLSCVASLLAWFGAVLAYLNVFPGNLLKTFPSNLLKHFLGNPLKTKTAKHIPLSICPLSAFLRFASLRVAAYRLAVLSRLCFELIKTAHFSDSVPPRPPSRHTVMPAVRHVSSSSCALSAHRHPPRLVLLLAHRAASSDAPPNRHARRGEKRGGGGCLAFLLILSVAIILL